MVYPICMTAYYTSVKTMDHWSRTAAWINLTGMPVWKKPYTKGFTFSHSICVRFKNWQNESMVTELRVVEEWVLTEKEQRHLPGCWNAWFLDVSDGYMDIMYVKIHQIILLGFVYIIDISKNSNNNVFSTLKNLDSTRDQFWLLCVLFLSLSPWQSRNSGNVCSVDQWLISYPYVSVQPLIVSLIKKWLKVSYLFLM
jgi:hypothetical protein